MSYAKGILDKNNSQSTPYLREGFVNVSLIKYINLKKDDTMFWCKWALNLFSIHKKNNIKIEGIAIHIFYNWSQCNRTAILNKFWYS